MLKRHFNVRAPSGGASRVGLPLLAAAMTLASPSFATAPGGNDSTFVSYEPPATQRRGGFAMGLSLGFGAATASGYPNKVESLSDPSAEVFTGPTMAGSLSLWLGGALRDWFTFGLGFRSTSGFGGDNLTSFPAALFHLEGFPLFFKGGPYRDLGLAFDGGLGTGTIFDAQAQPGGDSLANGGSMSFLGFTAFYEPLRFWHMSAGPGLSYTHSFSQSLGSHDVLLTFRMTFYGNQPKKAEKSTATSGRSVSGG